MARARTKLAGFTAVALGLALSACGTAAPSAEPASSADAKTTPPPAVSPVSTGISEDFSVLGALAELPVDAAGPGSLVTMADVQQVLDENGVSFGAPDDRQTLRDLARLTGGPGDPADPPMIPPSALMPQAGKDLAAIVGFTVFDVTRFAASERPPNGVAVIAGAFDARTLPSSLTDLGGGLLTDVDAPDNEVSLEDHGTRLNKLGAPTRFAVRDGRIAYSTSTPVVRAWIDGGTTLADDPAHAAVAGFLDDADVASAVFTVGSASPPAPFVTPAPFDLVGVGWKRGATIVAYHFASPDEAAAGVDALRTAWAEDPGQSGRPLSSWFTVQSAEAVGDVVGVTLQPTATGRAVSIYQMVLQGEPVVTPVMP